MSQVCNECGQDLDDEDFEDLESAYDVLEVEGPVCVDCIGEMFE